MSIKKYLPLLFILLSFTAKANYMLVQNVTKLGNNPTNKTIQIQFDLSWQNSWRDSINWDAAWIFIKFKDANGLWQHARINLAGYLSGAGTSNTIKVASDSVGAFVYRSALGSGNFNATSMQLQWNYGASGLTDASALEVRVFATEMVYVPQGDFNVAKTFYVETSSCCGNNNPNSFYAPGNNFPVINSRLSPVVTYNDGTAVSLRIKGDAGIDSNNDGVVDNLTYPTGYKAFYCYKYELTEQQYADFLNTLTSTQITNIGLAGLSISLNNGNYFSSTPNRACGNANASKIYSYADWSGLRPLSILEFNKASYGPLMPVLNQFLCCPGGYTASNSSNAFNFYEIGNGFSSTLLDVGSYATSTSTSRESSGASYYGIMDLTGNAFEPVISLSSLSFDKLNGNGILSLSGNTDVSNWNSSALIFIDQYSSFGVRSSGFRYVRSAE